MESDGFARTVPFPRPRTLEDDIAAAGSFFTSTTTATTNSRSYYIFFLLAVAAAIFSVFSAVLLLAKLPSLSDGGDSSVLHQVPEGHVGTYWRGGALLKSITSPGFHLKLPITRFEPIQVTIQTDQVVNRLRKEYVYETLMNYGVKYDKTWIYDKIHHEINQFCSAHTLQQVYVDMFDQIDDKMKAALQGDCTRYAPGIEVISVRITKPMIPDSIKRNYEQMEEERTKVLITIERQKVAEKEAETKKKIAITEAEKNAQVSKIMMEQKLMEKDSSKRQAEIENEIYIGHQKSLADADYYRCQIWCLTKD